MHRRSLTFLAALTAGLAGVPAGSADVITFDGFVNGQIMNTQIPGVTITAMNPNRVHDLAAIFDTNLTGIADPDLEGPNWSGGNLAGDPEAGGGGTTLGNVLIIAENNTGAGDGILDDPDDEGSRPGGVLIFEFDTALVSLGFDILDVEGVTEEPGSIDFFLNGGLIGTVNLADFINPVSSFHDPTIEFGNHTANRISPITAAQLNADMFDEVRFNMGGSGAIDNIDFTVVPAPGTLLLLGAAGLLRHRNRRRQA